MKHKISVPLTVQGIDRLIKTLDEYERWLNQKCQELVERLAQEGMTAAQWGFDMAYYVGTNDVKVTTEQRGENVMAVIATGHATLFIEFGSGVLMGYGHPEPLDYGPGTYPGKGHWDDPNGWYLPKEVQAETGQIKSYGNPPAMAMYNARKMLEQDLQRIAEEVFKD